MAYLDPKRRTRVVADANPVALGDGSLALVWSIEKFYFYLVGLDLELMTDHKPLEVIFMPISKSSARIERWLLRLQAFRFKVVYQTGKSNIADTNCYTRIVKNARSGISP